MSKPYVLIVLTFAALASAPNHASELPLPENVARGLCKGEWVNKMDAGVSICAYCEKTTAGTPKCEYFVCDEAGCDWIIVARKTPKAQWKVEQPKLPKAAVAPRK